MIVFTAVSTPMAVVVPPMSLSIDAGSPTTGTPCSAQSRWAPVSEPLPPITTSPSMPAAAIASAAFARPSTVKKRFDRADPSTVPPSPAARSTLGTGLSSPSRSIVSGRCSPSMSPS